MELLSAGLLILTGIGGLMLLKRVNALEAGRRQTFNCCFCGIELPVSENYCCQDRYGVMRSGMCKGCMIDFHAIEERHRLA